MTDFRAAGLMALALFALPQAAAAQDIKWEETFSMPKGAGLPNGQSVDILGIAPGDSYEAARARLEQIRSEGDDAGDLEELITQYTLQTPDGGLIAAEFVGEIRMKRDIPGTSRSKEQITVRLSAPSSGHQVIAIIRRLGYDEPSEQVRVSDLISAVDKRLGAMPEEIDSRSGVRLFRYQFDDGQLATPESVSNCYDFAKTWSDQGSLEMINQTGHCDVVYDIRVAPGMSDDHAKSVTFELYDNDRARANLTADYAFFDRYVAQVQRGGGATPEL